MLTAVDICNLTHLFSKLQGFDRNKSMILRFLGPKALATKGELQEEAQKLMSSLSRFCKMHPNILDGHF